MTLIVGVDGCPSGWLWASKDMDSGRLEAGIVRSFGELLRKLPEDSLVTVDIPIGLPERGSRDCDLAARTILGPRRSSVFPAPLRPMLEASSYEEACRIGTSIHGKKLSRQAFAILPKIREVDACLALVQARRQRVREIHPEVCFWALNGCRPLEHPKRSPEGAASRLALLLAVHGKGILELEPSVSGGRFAQDDLYDALAALWTAERIVMNRSVTLPEIPPQDATGLRIEMVY